MSQYHYNWHRPEIVMPDVLDDDVNMQADEDEEEQEAWDMLWGRQRARDVMTDYVQAPYGQLSPTMFAMRHREIVQRDGP